ncbi:hypothetical protein HPP92_021692 [Vanilla planifolia]|uniref:Uncharacterized protein n=1 Tax=Vanilla planifolia TaxID=51239 RepID=A0A835UHU7_VANPL|nr:hypothetical protein HPP92_021692 [Vanilla planifolia]
MCWELYNQPSKETYVDVAKDYGYGCGYGGGCRRRIVLCSYHGTATDQMVLFGMYQLEGAFLLLLPEAVEVLGGLAEDLDAARHRFISEVNKPPRGKRKQALIPLSQRAALVSWPSTNVNGGTANTLVPASDICISQPNALESPSLSNPKPMAQDCLSQYKRIHETKLSQLGMANVDDEENCLYQYKRTVSSKEAAKDMTKRAAQNFAHEGKKPGVVGLHWEMHGTKGPEGEVSMK